MSTPMESQQNQKLPVCAMCGTPESEHLFMTANEAHAFVASGPELEKCYALLPDGGNRPLSQRIELLLAPPERKKANYIGPPGVFLLEQCCQHINAAFGDFGCCLVGSAIERAGWRDVDVRFIMPDAEFCVLFPGACPDQALWEHDPRWLLLTVSITEWMRRVTGLPIDFQIQPQTFANKHHNKTRSAIGLRVAKPEAKSE